MPPLVETTASPAEAVANQPADGAQPPIEQATPVAQRDEPNKEEKARALLKGEPPADAEPDLSDEASVDAHFDPETGELLEDDPTAAQGGQPANAEGEANDAGAEASEADAGEDDEEPDGGDRKARRIRVKRDALSDRDFAILTLAKDKRITFAEAEQQLFGTAAPEQETAQQNRATQDQPTAQEISDEIGLLRAAREEAREAYDEKRADKINDRIVELRDQLKEMQRFEATRAEAAQQTAAQRYATAETAAIHRATEMYPDANTAGSKLNEAMQAKAASIRNEDPQFFHNPKWPILLAVETATELGIAAKVKGDVKGQAGKPALTAAQMAAPKKTTRPAPTPAPGTATGAKTNSDAALREQLSAAKANRDVDAIKAVMRKLSASA